MMISLQNVKRELHFSKIPPRFDGAKMRGIRTHFIRFNTLACFVACLRPLNVSLGLDNVLLLKVHQRGD